MKAEELMIGDYVFVGDDKTPIEITHISKSGDYSYLKPIPLTVEILEKNGFENIGDDTYQLTEKPYWFWIDFYKHEYGCEYDTSTYEYEDTERCFKKRGIPYVHELQHALRLCGIEKEIKL